MTSFQKRPSLRTLRERRRGTLFLSALALLAFALPCSAQRAQPVVMISIDGLRPDAVTQAEAHGLRVPNLRRFVTEGTYAEGVTGVVPTLTYPSHTTLVTGVAPAVHGILANTTFDPLFRNQIGWYWYAEQEHAPTLWQAAHAGGLTTASVNWPVTVDAPDIDYNMPEYWRASTADDVRLQRALARPLGLQQALEATDGPWIDGNRTTVDADALRTRFTITLLGRNRPAFLTVHLSALDETEHQTAPFSVESNHTLEAIDGMIGQLRDAALAINPNTVLVVVSDHGFARTDYRVHLYIPLLQAGLLTASQDGKGVAGLTSWKAPLWPAGGSGAVMVNDPNDTGSRESILKLLTALARDPANCIDRILSRDELVGMGGFPGAEALVVLRPPFQMGYALSGPLVTAAPLHRHAWLFTLQPRHALVVFHYGYGHSTGARSGAGRHASDRSHRCHFARCKAALCATAAPFAALNCHRELSLARIRDREPLLKTTLLDARFGASTVGLGTSRGITLIVYLMWFGLNKDRWREQARALATR